MANYILRGLLYSLSVYAIHALSKPLEQRVVDEKPNAQIHLFGFYWLGMTTADWLIRKIAIKT